MRSFRFPAMARTLLMLFVGFGAVGRSSAAEASDIQKIEIADGIYQFMTVADRYAERINSVVIVNEKDVLVFDSNTRPSTTRAILAEIRKITYKPVRYVVNSHWHPDHWSGNEVYAQAFPNVEIIATEETYQVMQYVASVWPPRFASGLAAGKAALDKEVSSGKQADGTVLTDEQRRADEETFRLDEGFINELVNVHRTYPTLTYGEKLILYHGGREFRFMSMVGDSSGTTVLYLPKERVLVTGDLLVNPLPYGAGPHLNRWIDSLKALNQLDVKVVVPGHGPAEHDKCYVNLEIELFEAAVRQVRESLKKGLITVQEVQKAVNLEEFRARFTKGNKDLDPQFDGLCASLAKRAYRDARDEFEFQQ